MPNARILLSCLLLGCVSIVSALSFATGPDESSSPLAQARSLDQVGFPQELYGWVSPPDNPQTPGKVALGRELFFDKRLSEDNTQACASCHIPAKGFTDQQPTSDGIHHQFGQRNAPTVLNAAFNVLQFWDGREPTLEEQAKDPIVNPIEMGMKNFDEVVTKVSGMPEYQDKFKAVFGGPVTMFNIQQALAAYERAQVTFNSPFDRFMAGDQKAISDQARRGWSIFNGKGRCMSCHGWNPTQPLFSDNRFHNIGVSAHKSDFVPLARKALTLLAQGGGSQQLDQLAIQTDMSGLGRFLVTKDPHDIGGFRTMGLRNLLVTQPYFHDGSQVTLWDVVDHYNKGGVQNPFLDGGIIPLGLTAPEINDLVAFLATLTSPEYAAAAQVEFKKQLKLSRTSRPQRDTAAAMGLDGRNGPGLGGPFGDIGPSQMPENPALLGGR
jgi:cytochrome c peroxidase